jgi:glycerol-3-phosphate acyltransferase PlsY
MPDPINWGLSLPYYLAALTLGYILGSIPFGLIITKVAGTTDPRSVGSGNIGATNILRAGGKTLAALTLAADLLKGTAAALIGLQWGPDTGIIAGFAAFFGHLVPIWLKFRGGKGVATYIGVLLGLFWPAALIFCAIWLFVAWASRYSSLSALVASAATPPFLAWFGQWQTMELFVVLTILVFIRHSSNIRRLATGKESKIGGS